MGSTEDLKKNVVSCKGQEIRLPAGDYNKVYILAAATEDTSGIFKVNGTPVKVLVANWKGFMGQHYDRQFDVDGFTVRNIKEPFLKHDNIAWFASHYHFGYPTRNEPYTYSYIFKYEISLPANAGSITLPDNAKIKIFALTTAKKEGDDIQILQPLTDDFSDSKPYALRKAEN